LSLTVGGDSGASSIGTPTDPVASGVSNGTVIGLLKAQRSSLAAIVLLLGAGLPAALVAGRLDVDAKTATATAAAPVYTEGSTVRLSTDLTGNVRSNPTAGRLDSLRRVQKVDTVAAAFINPATLAGVAIPAVNTGATLTIPAAGAGLFHYITAILIQRAATAALAGTALLAVTTTNLPGALQWRFGNAMVAGGTQTDLNMVFVQPIKSSVANTATTVVVPAPGAAVSWTVVVHYYTGP
jgi:hypothetical protein